MASLATAVAAVRALSIEVVAYESLFQCNPEDLKQITLPIKFIANPQARGYYMLQSYFTDQDNQTVWYAAFILEDGAIMGGLGTMTAGATAKGPLCFDATLGGGGMECLARAGDFDSIIHLNIETADSGTTWKAEFIDTATNTTTPIGTYTMPSALWFPCRARNALTFQQGGTTACCSLPRFETDVFKPSSSSSGVGLSHMTQPRGVSWDCTGKDGFKTTELAGTRGWKVEFGFKGGDAVCLLAAS